jgi:hypothetical protein
MRAEVAVAHFNGNTHFTVSDIQEAFAHNWAGVGESHGGE